MERELLMTGIGGQGIQLAAQVLARAAIANGTNVQLFGSYGGMMRGGNTEATLVFADEAIESPPTVAHAWSAIVMHPEHAASVTPRVVDAGLLLVNSSLCAGADIDRQRDRVRVADVPATELAVDAGNIMAASMVMVGAYAALSRVVTLESIGAAIEASLPSYRTQHIELNQRAVDSGWAAAA
jgi:Pyruvate/2-oxoacid:ferredoxin oxidoreductase gamma subunit